jgi:hypothetical protein
MHHLHFNHLAVIVSALILWFLGAAWYSPALFAKPWMAMLGIQKDAPNKKSLVPGMISSLICDLILSFILAHVILWAGAATFEWGALIGFICWVGFFAAPNLPQGIYENRPFKLFAINNGYWLVGLILVGGLLAVWH